MKRPKSPPKSTSKQAATAQRGAPAAGPTVSATRLRELIEEATVDCHDEDEARMGFLASIEDALALPFETEVFGAPVEVTAVEENEAEELVAVCRRGKHVQRIPLADLLLSSPPPAGAEWIAAWRHWRGGNE